MPSTKTLGQAYEVHFKSKVVVVHTGTNYARGWSRIPLINAEASISKVYLLVAGERFDPQWYLDPVQRKRMRALEKAWRGERKRSRRR